MKKGQVAGVELERVAVTTLQSLNNAMVDHPRVASLKELQLIYVDLRRKGKSIDKEERKIASIPVEFGGR